VKGSSSHLSNAIRGVTEGYRKELKVVGTGYRVRKEGDRFVFTVGYSHPVYYTVPEEYRKYVKAEVQGGTERIHRKGYPLR